MLVENPEKMTPTAEASADTYFGGYTADQPHPSMPSFSWGS
jgi:hypothetical protein